MRPFEFVIVFLSFVYSLGLTHLLFAITRMVRHRRVLVFSWTHALWMLNVLLGLFANWISLWDFHNVAVISLPALLAGLAMAISNYLVCALVSPDFEDCETYDMHAFQAREGRTYLAAYLGLAVVAFAVNYAAAAGVGLTKWASENWIAGTAIPTLLLPMIVRKRWAEFVAGLVFCALNAVAFVVYYPELS